ncbi:MAG: outer membrane beta-barrel protein [Gammaproteobacteria bacterium]|nr:outer membrane beta-barrel protein [Gammaproteobacteria bacterium]
MNKLSIMAKTVIITMSMVGIAYADKDFAHHSLLNSWTGFYVGANAGVMFNNAQLKSQQLGFTDPNDTCNASSNLSSFFPGIQLGYMHQFSSYFVSGIEANITLNTKQKDTLGCTSAYSNTIYDRFSFRNQLQSSIKGRLGRALNWNKSVILPYLTAGVSFANVGLTYRNEGGDYYSKNTTSPGWLIGAGIEWAFSQNWSLRAEYSYADYGNAINLNIPGVYGLLDPNGSAHANLSSNNVVVSINYWI